MSRPCVESIIVFGIINEFLNYLFAKFECCSSVNKINLPSLYVAAYKFRSLRAEHALVRRANIPSDVPLCKSARRVLLLGINTA